MNNQKTMKYPKLPLPLAIVGVIVLIFLLLQFIPWQALALVAVIALLIFAFLGHLRLQVEEEQKAKRAAAIPYYQPSQKPELPPAPRTNPRPGFDLSPEEFQQLSQRYEQGYRYQKPTPTQSKSWSPLTGITYGSDQVKQDHPMDYDQPQAQYPEQTPPMV